MLGSGRLFPMHWQVTQRTDEVYVRKAGFVQAWSFIDWTAGAAIVVHKIPRPWGNLPSVVGVPIPASGRGSISRNDLTGKMCARALLGRTQTSTLREDERCRLVKQRKRLAELPIDKTRFEAWVTGRN